MSPSHLPQAIIFCAKPITASRPEASDVITAYTKNSVRPLRTSSFITRTLKNKGLNKILAKLKRHVEFLIMKETPQ